MLCEKCQTKVDECERHCPHETAVEVDADFSIELNNFNFTVKNKDKVITFVEMDYNLEFLKYACVFYNRLATLNNVIQIRDRVTGLRIVRDRKVDMKTIYRQLKSASKLRELNFRK